MKRSEPRQKLANTYLTIGRAANDHSSEHDAHYPIQNISRGGIRFCCNEHFDIDERVSLCLYIDEKLTHQAKGRICYHDEDKEHNNFYGVSFLDNYIHM